MIKRNEASKITDAYYEVERILNENANMLLTKEEIYVRFPCDNEGLPYISISSMENALRNLAHMRHIDVVYVRGIRHFGIAQH